MDQPPRTITVTKRGRSRLSRITITYPPDPGPAKPPRYDADRARELLARTATMPATKHDLRVVLTEYRHALHALLTDPRA